MRGVSAGCVGGTCLCITAVQHIFNPLNSPICLLSVHHCKKRRLQYAWWLLSKYFESIIPHYFSLQGEYLGAKTRTQKRGVNIGWQMSTRRRVSKVRIISWVFYLVGSIMLVLFNQMHPFLSLLLNQNLHTTCMLYAGKYKLEYFCIYNIPNLKSCNFS
jgi:hypothetical protein